MQSIEFDRSFDPVKVFSCNSHNCISVVREITVTLNRLFWKFNRLKTFFQQKHFGLFLLKTVLIKIIVNLFSTSEVMNHATSD